ncbi:MurT ligase domain-containing protein [Bacillus sp. Brlt_9]|uniref:MurT ligase domain-containing protein n=1 Tax=Bacillus sp. Brlt_9 TaxID=3110916 RepID=UPI003F7C3FFE
MPVKCSVVAAKMAQKASRLLNKNGSNIPGVVARKIDKNILHKLSKRAEKIIFISGTNGKTTTSQIVGHIFAANGLRTIHNSEGSNMITGITTAFIDNESVLLSKKADVAVIEIDEGSIARVTKEVQPDIMVFTNFFRDQLDRFGEIDTLVEKIGSVIKETNSKLVLNADDPFVSRLGRIGMEAEYFGLGTKSFKFEQHNMIESTFCPECGKALEYDHIHYGQLGHYHCACGFSRVEPKYEIKEVNIDIKKGLTLNLNEETFSLPILGSYNSINALAAISVCLEFGLTPEQIQNALNTFNVENGRMESFENSDSNVILNLAKNPAGVNVSLSESNYNNERRQYLFALNDLAYDGRDISWIWDADFEKINESLTERVICSGIRAADMAVRIKYAGIPEEKIEIIEDIDSAINELTNHNINSYVVPNYTVLEPTRKALVKRLKNN